MIFWICLAFGALFAFIAMRKDFVKVWVFAFNLMFSIYVSVAITSALGKYVPEAFGGQLACASMLFGAAIIVFIVMQFLAKSFILDNAEITLNEIFIKITTPMIGFFIGYVLAGFLLFVIFISPVQSISFVKKMGLESNFAKSIARPIRLVCCLADNASVQNNQENLDSVVDWLEGPLASEPQVVSDDAVETKTQEQ